MDLRFIGTVQFFFKVFFGQRYLPPSLSKFGAFCELEGSPFGIFGDFFRKEKMFGFLMFRARVKAFFESYGDSLGLSWTVVNNVTHC